MMQTERLDEAIEFIRDTIGDDFTHADFRPALRTGTVLCRMMNQIKPGSVKINTVEKPFPQMENIAAYIAACRGMGVPESAIFVTIDLFEMRDTDQVIRNILALKRLTDMRDSSFNNFPVKKLNMSTDKLVAAPISPRVRALRKEPSGVKIIEASPKSKRMTPTPSTPPSPRPVIISDEKSEENSGKSQAVADYNEIKVDQGGQNSVQQITQKFSQKYPSIPAISSKKPAKTESLNFENRPVLQKANTFGANREVNETPFGSVKLRSVQRDKVVVDTPFPAARTPNTLHNFKERFAALSMEKISTPVPEESKDDVITDIIVHEMARQMYNNSVHKLPPALLGLREVTCDDVIPVDMTELVRVNSGNFLLEELDALLARFPAPPTTTVSMPFPAKTEIEIKPTPAQKLEPQVQNDVEAKAEEQRLLKESAKLKMQQKAEAREKLARERIQRERARQAFKSFSSSPQLLKTAEPKVADPMQRYTLRSKQRFIIPQTDKEECGIMKAAKEMSAFVEIERKKSGNVLLQ